MNENFSTGTVTLVGAGPGDPDLITVAGLRALQAADVVLYDRLAPVELLDGINAEIINVGKIPRGEFTPQEVINQLLIEHAKAGRNVVRFKGGDSFVFGRGGEEALALAQAGIQVKVIPGVTSALAAPGLAGIPVTHRQLSQGVTIVSGHVPPGDQRSKLDWQALAKTNTTLVILMGVKFLPQISAELVDAGLDGNTPAAIVSSAATEQMRIYRSQLDSLAKLAEDNDIQPPSITVIGQVAAIDLFS